MKLLIVAALVFATLTVPATAQSPSRDEQVTAWLADAKVAWGIDLVTQVDQGAIFETPDRPQPRAWAAPYYPPADAYYGYQCRIWLSPSFWDDPTVTDAHRATLIAHEYGHCLGLEHPAKGGEPPQVMATSSATVTEWDLAKLRLVSPYWHTLRLPMAGR